MNKLESTIYNLVRKNPALKQFVRNMGCGRVGSPGRICLQVFPEGFPDCSGRPFAEPLLPG